MRIRDSIDAAFRLHADELALALRTRGFFLAAWTLGEDRYDLVVEPRYGGRVASADIRGGTQSVVVSIEIEPFKTPLGRRHYWRCPDCRGRFVYLYVSRMRCACRRCLHLAYPSQWRTVGGRFSALYDAVRVMETSERMSKRRRWQARHRRNRRRISRRRA